MICRQCGATMYLDDKDFDFKGKYDNYWNCPNCQTSLIEHYTTKFANTIK